MRLIQSIKEENLPIMYDVLGKVKGPNGIIHKRMAESETKMVSIYWSGIDRLYYYIIPNFQKAEFHSRKHVDFVLWCRAVKINKFGYHLSDSGKSLLLAIIASINAKRYTTTLNYENNVVSQEDIEKVFSMKPVYSNELIPYSESSKSNKSTKGKTIYVLDASGNIIEPYPFKTITELSKILNLSRAGISAYLDTGKLYHNYYLYSKQPK